MVSIGLHFTMRASDLWHGTMVIGRTRPWRFAGYWAIVLAVAAICAYMLDWSFTHGFGLPGPAGWAIDLLVIVGVVTLAWSRQFAVAARAQGEVRVTVDDDGVRMANARAASDNPWTFYDRSVETDHAFILVRNEGRGLRQFTPLPKRGLSDPADVDRLRETIRDRIGAGTKSMRPPLSAHGSDPEVASEGLGIAHPAAETGVDLIFTPTYSELRQALRARRSDVARTALLVLGVVSAVAVGAILGLLVIMLASGVIEPERRPRTLGVMAFFLASVTLLAVAQRLAIRRMAAAMADTYVSVDESGIQTHRSGRAVHESWASFARWTETKDAFVLLGADPAPARFWLLPKRALKTTGDVERLRTLLNVHLPPDR